MAIDDKIRVASIAKQYGLNKVMIHRWISQYQTLGDGAFVGRGNSTPENAKIKQLEKQLEEARMENEILKKAAAYFLNPKEEE